MNEYKTEAAKATIAGLEPGMRRVDITFKIMRTSKETIIDSFRDKGSHRVLDAVVGDSTAIVMMPIWNETIDSINVGGTYTLTNGYTGLFKGSLRLHLGKYGSIVSADEKIDEVNSELDMSSINFNASP